MRALLPEPAEDVDVHAYYARDWIERGGLRVDFVSSVDGAATAGGVSRGLQTPGDNRVFAAMRDLADVVLVGAGTARAEGYSAIRLSDRRRDWRSDAGLDVELPTAVVTRSVALRPDSSLFAGPVRTIVITCAAADATRRAALETVADVVVVGDDDVDLAAARAALEARGLRRILSEGGPTLFADLCAAGVADELCLTVSPLVVGPGPARIVASRAWDAPPADAHLVHLLEEDGALFLRYKIVR
jgi:riboflavin biosynthesis pyrimidine reductase